MKIWSSADAAYNNMESNTRVSVKLYCTGQYKTSIKSVEPVGDVLALYKSYRKDKQGSYVKLYGLYKQ